MAREVKDHNQGCVYTTVQTVPLPAQPSATNVCVINQPTPGVAGGNNVIMVSDPERQILWYSIDKIQLFFFLHSTKVTIKADLITMAVNIIRPSNPWNSDICGCFEDMQCCCFGFWCCPCMACITSRDFGEYLCLPLVDLPGPAIAAFFGVPLFTPAASLAMRAAIRHRYNIEGCGDQLAEGNLCGDILITCFCIWCSWCQMAREVKVRKKGSVYTFVQLRTSPGQPSAMNVATSNDCVINQPTPGVAGGNNVIMVSDPGAMAGPMAGPSYYMPEEPPSYGSAMALNMY
ncbi:hypothetical protein DPEC_G00238640 [Dallia pectoralis]|uniref:Uncharacterized protein n=1 Tax=Dallia pectoralis TaxID=75939 RepID=A0ACC2FZC0_DALPE|nr:hypothetical protein DPEC_G00238640 [Dallia pectoralis]